MNLVAVLLRLVLCISLIANGVGGAQAAVRMDFDHAAHAGAQATIETPATATPAVAAVPPCHRDGMQATHATMSHATPAASAHTAKHDASAALSTPKRDDCCKGKSCRCACVHASCAAMTAVVFPAPLRPVTRVAALVIDHPQPRLPHLTRPPIG